MANEFPDWLRTMRRARGLTQRQMRLPSGTIAAYESGRRRPKTFLQKQELAGALQVSLEALYAALGEEAPATADIYQMICKGEWSDAYRAIQHLQLEAYKTGNTAVLSEAHDLMSRLSAAQPKAALADTLAIDNPLQALDWGSAALRNNQWLSALALFKATVTVLPTQSTLWGRLYNNLAIAHQALGHLDDAIAWDEAYIAWAESESNAWRVVIAHALALMHKVLRNPGADIAKHATVLNQWRNLETGLADPLVECWLLDAEARNYLAAGEMGKVRVLAEQYGRRVAEHASCRGEQLRFADVQAQILAADGSREKATTLLQTVLSQPAHLHEPSYIRLEVAQTWARLDGTVLVWRQLMQSYWSLGARGWLERLLAEWQQVEPGASLDVPPLIIPA